MEILSNNFFNSITGGTLFSQLATINNKIVAINAELSNAKSKYGWCMDHRLRSCSKETGSSKEQWRDYINRRENELARAKIEQKKLQSQYDTSLTTAQKQKIVEQVEHETEILEQKEWGERGKKLAIYAGATGLLLLLGVVIYKKIKA